MFRELRKYIDDQNVKFAEEKKEAECKVDSAKEKVWNKYSAIHAADGSVFGYINIYSFYSIQKLVAALTY